MENISRTTHDYQKERKK